MKLLDKLRLISSSSTLITYFTASLRGFITGTTAFIKGGLVCIACPLGVLQILAASLILTNQLLLALATTSLFLLVAGRFFCGWMCPTGAVVHSTHRPRGRRWGITAPLAIITVLVSSFLARLPVLCVICPVGIPFKLVFAYIFGIDIYLLVLALAGWLVLNAYISRKGFSWCGTLCPVGYLLGLISPKPLLHVSTNANCTRCRVCVLSCPSNINIPEAKLSDRVRCTLCLKCLEHCRFRGVELRFYKKKILG